MKARTLLAAVAALTILTSSCEDWLKATSDTEFQADDLLKSRDGFQDALTGVYIAMGSSSIYGGLSTWQALDLVCYPYKKLSQGLRFPNWQMHNYHSQLVMSDISSMWRGYYNVIANVNFILKNLEHSRKLFSSELEYNLYRGELLGLRAYLHFDILRIWGVPVWNETNASKLTIPYSTVYSKNAVMQQSYSQTITLLEKDLEEAILCLSDDPVTGVMTEEFAVGPNADGYWNNRTCHMNLYACYALKARIAQWKEEYQEAALYARKAIDGALASGKVKWTNPESIIGEHILQNIDFTFSNEQIFYLEITGLFSAAAPQLTPSALSSSDAYLLSDNLVSGVLYPLIDEHGLLSGAEDIRGTLISLKYYSGAYASYRLYGADDMPRTLRNRMSLVRLSEMYYILAESSLKAGDGASCKAALDTVRAARGILDPIPADVDPARALGLEYLREFINEGQYFFWLKHHGLEDNPVKEYVTLSEDNLILPYPDEEINYGRKQEL